jgi:hypothetical protein
MPADMNTAENLRLLNSLPDKLVVEITGVNRIEITYTPKTERTLFDICDLNGRILKTGGITKANTSVDVSDLYDDQYILLILDGDQLCSKKFRLEAQASQ